MVEEIFSKTKLCASKGEETIYKILLKNNINFFMQHTFEDCINPKTQHFLYFDFYLPDYNCCIEYDGKQHFEPIEYFGGEESFKERCYRDKIKDKYCKQKNIHLIRIKYDCKNIEDTILQQLKI